MKYSARSSCEREKLHELKGKCIKKFKITIYISTYVFNKKDMEMNIFTFMKKFNKKYYQHYDDDANNNTTIDFVNDDCLAEIFMYLPACERPKIALVCKNWKRALDYTWPNVKKLELTHWEYNNCPSYLNKYPKINEQVRFLRSLLDKYGRYLTELDLTAHGYCGIMRVVNESCPNLVKLRLRFKYDEPTFNAFSRLSKLKILKIIFQHVNGYLSDRLIYSLKSLAGTLTELTLSNWNEEDLYESLRIPNSFIEIIPELKALKSIETAGILIETDLYMQLKNLGIIVISHDRRWLNNNIYNFFLYKKVTTLNLRSYQVTDDCLYTIANCFNQLKFLTISCKRITDAGMVTISKMSNLTHLHLRGPSQVTDSSIKLLKNLTFLHLPYSNKITDVSIAKVFENSPEMKMFYFLGSAINSELLKKPAEIATKQKKILRVALLHSPGIKQYESQYLHLVLLNSSKKVVYWTINFKGK